MSASDIMISVAVRISVRKCQQVTLCEFACKSSNTDGAKQKPFTPLIQPHWHLLHPISPSQQPRGRMLGRVGFAH